MSVKRKILVTAALPYANGDIHLGHLVEYLQTDFWVRFQKMRGHECLYICADDTHGTPVMVSARARGISPEELIAEKNLDHRRDFAAFEIEFDNYYSTHSPENQALAEEFFAAMQRDGHIAVRPVKQFFCSRDRMFLPDRFVTGTCPRCRAEGQYGDSCDKCGAAYSPAELESPACSICGTVPVERESDHLFFRLENFRAFLQEWVSLHTPREVANKLGEWFGEELRDWDISRDAPYFGIPIPGYPDKFFYVWLDAPLGYISSTMDWARRSQRDFREFWHSGEAELYHFIGKDIVYFHTLFWPAMLKAAGYKTPDQVFVHGFLTINGEKMSKSKGTFIKAATYLEQLDPLYLRYYYACKLGANLDDIDLNLQDFVNKVNAELIGKISNLASRSLQMVDRAGGVLGRLTPAGRELLAASGEKAGQVAELYEKREFSKALVEIRGLAEAANRYFDEQKPWEKIKADPEQGLAVLTDVINLFRRLVIMLKPILPSWAGLVEEILREKPYTWDSLGEELESVPVGPFRMLAARIEKEKVNMIIEQSQEKPAEQQPAVEHEALCPTVSFADFQKIDLRVARVLEAEIIPEADKLLRLKVDIGLETRSIIAGIRQAYKAEDLVGKLIVVAANLEPRKMKFGLSEGMLLAAGPGGAEVFVLSPDSGARPGQRIH